MKPSAELRNLITAAGLKLIEAGVTGGGHVKVRLQREDGAAANFTFPSTGSDARGAKNRLSDLRRFARGDFNPVLERKAR